MLPIHNWPWVRNASESVVMPLFFLFASRRTFYRQREWVEAALYTVTFPPAHPQHPTTQMYNGHWSQRQHASETTVHETGLQCLVCTKEVKTLFSVNQAHNPPPY